MSLHIRCAACLVSLLECASPALRIENQEAIPMFVRSLLAMSIAGLFAWTSAADQPPTPPAPPPPTKAPKVVQVSTPITHANLSVFVLHGADTLPSRAFLTLQEALDQKKVVVNETSNVNQLTVENVAPDTEVFLMTGDIVKGGKQDRAIAFDMILPPKSGAIPIGSFCVESGRWRQRGAEAAVAFSGSMNQVVGKDIKAAINRDNDQGKVWEEVKKAQEKLSKNVAFPVADLASPSSLQLTLENKKVQEKLEAYEKALAKAIEGKDVIGVAFAVNGQLSGAEVYASSALLARLWPKLLKAAATEALADLDDKKKFEPATVKSVEEFLAEAMAEPAKEVAMVANVRDNAGQAVNPAPAQNRVGQQAGVQVGNGRQGDNEAQIPTRVRIVRYDGKKAMCVECQDRQQPGLVIHRSYIAK
jgi:hypothetical protein